MHAKPVEFDWLGPARNVAPFGWLETGQRVIVIDRELAELMHALPGLWRFESSNIELTDAAEIVTDASLGSSFRVILGGNRTLAAPTNPYDGQRIVWEFIQDETGNRTITLDAVFAFGDQITGVTLSTDPGARDFMTAMYNAIAGKWFVIGLVHGYTAA